MPAPRGQAKSRKSPIKKSSPQLKELKKNTKPRVIITYAEKVNGLTWLERAIEENRNKPAFITNEALTNFLEEVVIYMEKTWLTRTELAARSGLAPAQITRIMGGDHNLTARTMGRLVAALGKRLKISLA